MSKIASVCRENTISGAALFGAFALLLGRGSGQGINGEQPPLLEMQKLSYREKKTN